MAQVTSGEDRIVTAANVFTTVRLLCVPVFVWLLTRSHHRDWVAAAVLLGVLGATDWIDGQLARRLHQVTRLGKVLDPTADRVLLATATIGILAVGAVPVPIAVIALVREGLVAGGTLTLAAAGARRIDVVLVGKAGTFCLMCAMPLFLLAGSDVSWHHLARVLAWVFAVAGLVSGWAAVGFYARAARRALRERDECRATAPAEEAAV